MYRYEGELSYHDNSGLKLTRITPEKTFKEELEYLIIKHKVHETTGYAPKMLTESILNHIGEVRSIIYRHDCEMSLKGDKDEIKAFRNKPLPLVITIPNITPEDYENIIKKMNEAINEDRNIKK